MIFKTLTYSGQYIDFGGLKSGIYLNNWPWLFSPIIEIDQIKHRFLLLGESNMSESRAAQYEFYVWNLMKCQLITLEMQFVEGKDGTHKVVMHDGKFVDFYYLAKEIKYCKVPRVWPADHSILKLIEIYDIMDDRIPIPNGVPGLAQQNLKDCEMKPIKFKILDHD